MSKYLKVIRNYLKISFKKLFKKVKNLNNEEKRKRLQNITWAWQCYDEYNGFFMTNDFMIYLLYQCACGYKFGRCYNSTSMCANM